MAAAPCSLFLPEIYRLALTAACGGNPDAFADSAANLQRAASSPRQEQQSNWSLTRQGGNIMAFSPGGDRDTGTAGRAAADGDPRRRSGLRLAMGETT
jgi:hypothetical protein